jgi:hypothetical protein
LSISAFEKTPILQALTRSKHPVQGQHFDNQLNLFHL